MHRHSHTIWKRYIRVLEKNKPIQTIVERYTQLKAVSYVDEIIPYAREKDLEDILEMYHINVRILGEEYREKDFTGKDICKRRDIDLHFNKRDHRFSTSDLRKRVCEQHGEKSTSTKDLFSWKNIYKKERCRRCRSSTVSLYIQ